MRIAFALAVLAGLLLSLTGCNGNADIPPDQQKAYSDRDPTHFHKPPAGMGPGGGGPPKGGPPPGATGGK